MILLTVDLVARVSVSWLLVGVIIGNTVLPFQAIKPLAWIGLAHPGD